MRVLLINSVCGTGSTGRICAELAQKYEAEGHTVKIAYGRKGYVPEEYKKYAVRIGNGFDVRVHGIYTRLTDRHGLASKRATRLFLKWANAFNPDLLWLHNIHGYYINYELLFQWIKSRPDMEVKWTLHDCWAFTGHCAHFTVANCKQWETCCLHCTQKSRYPRSIWLDSCCRNFERKRSAFLGVKNMALITPSQWLAGLVKQSFLKDYLVEVHPNKIDRSIFRPTPSDFREHYGLDKRKIILGVANVWDRYKGLEDFIELAKMLDDRYAVVLVGLNDKQIQKLPKQVIGLKRTNDPKELAAIYTAADVFVNPTYEDNYPTTNLEAQACGTQVITYGTGGCPETITRADSYVVPAGDINALRKCICKEGDL